MQRILNAKPSITQLEIDYVTDAVANGWGSDCYGYLHRFTDQALLLTEWPVLMPGEQCIDTIPVLTVNNSGRNGIDVDALFDEIQTG